MDFQDDFYKKAKINGQYFMELIVFFKFAWLK